MKEINIFIDKNHISVVSNYNNEYEIIKIKGETHYPIEDLSEQISSICEYLKNIFNIDNSSNVRIVVFRLKEYDEALKLIRESFASIGEIADHFIEPVNIYNSDISLFLEKDKEFNAKLEEANTLLNSRNDQIKKITKEKNELLNKFNDISEKYDLLMNEEKEREKTIRTVIYAEKEGVFKILISRKNSTRIMKNEEIGQYYDSLQDLKKMAFPFIVLNGISGTESSPINGYIYWLETCYTVVKEESLSGKPIKFFVVKKGTPIAVISNKKDDSIEEIEKWMMENKKSVGKK